jgi:hypothetical protein
MGRLICTVLTAGLLHADGSSQQCEVSIQHRSDIVSTCNHIVMTMMHDDLGRPYLYVANKEAGFTVYDISTIASPTLVATIPTGALDSLDVMNVTQSGTYVYLHANEIRYETLCRRLFLSTGKSDMYVLDVTNPAHPDACDAYGTARRGLQLTLPCVEGSSSLNCCIAAPVFSASSATT